MLCRHLKCLHVRVSNKQYVYMVSLYGFYVRCFMLVITKNSKLYTMHVMRKKAQ